MARHRVLLHGRPAGMIAGLLLAVAAAGFLGPGTLAHLGISSTATGPSCGSAMSRSTWST